MCESVCDHYTECTNCTKDECIWCQNNERCIDKNAYTSSFPYGQCREWTTDEHRCRASPGLLLKKAICKIKSIMSD